MARITALKRKSRKNLRVLYVTYTLCMSITLKKLNVVSLSVYMLVNITEFKSVSRF